MSERAGDGCREAAPMRTVRAVILHRHALFRDLMATALHDLGPIDVVAATADPEEALDLVLAERPDTLLIECYDGFVDRRKMLELFCRVAVELPEFLLIAADLSTSRIELMHDSIAERDHLGGLQPLLQHGVS